MKFYELIRKMEYQVNRTVKHYQDDFYEYDIPFLAENCRSSQPIEFAWFLRDTGTHICSNKNEDFELYKNLYREQNDMEFKLTYTPVESSWSGTWSMEKIS